MPSQHVPSEQKLGSPFDHHPSESLMISCGTIPIDPDSRRIALLYDPKSKLTFPPKGRKNISEYLLDAALRETHEETGLTVSPLPLLIPTRATPLSSPTPSALTEAIKQGKNPDITDDVLNTEPLCVSAFTCGHTGAYKLVFWFAGKVDETEARREGTMEPWESHRVVEWVDAREAGGKMSFASDAEAVDKLLRDMRSSGYSI